MPPERHSPPPSRPPRDRHTGPPFGGGGGAGGPRRSFGSGGGGFSGGPPRGDRPPFVPRPAPPPAEPLHTVRLREGDREVEVSGSPAFVRQALDDLPALLARFRGETPPPARPASISMPPPPVSAPAPPKHNDNDAHHGHDEPHATNGNGAATANGDLEDEVFDVLARAEHPLSVATIRERMGSHASGQQIRRILERAADRVVATDERPAAYTLR